LDCGYFLLSSSLLQDETRKKETETNTINIKFIILLFFFMIINLINKLLKRIFHHLRIIRYPTCFYIGVITGNRKQQRSGCTFIRYLFCKYPFTVFGISSINYFIWI